VNAKTDRLVLLALICFQLKRHAIITAF
jgi:hypothetical protein